MLSTTKSPVTNFIMMIAALTGIGRLQAWLLPTDCLRSLGNWPPFQRAFRQSVGNLPSLQEALAAERSDLARSEGK